MLIIIFLPTFLVHVWFKILWRRELGLPCLLNEVNAGKYSGLTFLPAHLCGRELQLTFFSLPTYG
jgi:hypothetical protein